MAYPPTQPSRCYRRLSLTGWTPYPRGDLNSQPRTRHSPVRVLPNWNYVGCMIDEHSFYSTPYMYAWSHQDLCVVPARPVFCAGPDSVHTAGIEPATWEDFSLTPLCHLSYVCAPEGLSICTPNIRSDPFEAHSSLPIRGSTCYADVGRPALMHTYLSCGLFLMVDHPRKSNA